MKAQKPDTLCIHAGYSPKNGEPRVAPIVQSTTYVYESSQEMGALFDLQEEGFFYTRLGNPTLDVVEKKIAALEGGVGAMLTSSGQAASLMAVLNICPAGFHVVSSSAIYGGTFNLFYKTMKEMGIETTFVSPHRHPGGAPGRHPAQHPGRVRRDPGQPPPWWWPTWRPSPRLPTRRACPSSWTTPSPPPSTAAPSTSAPTSSPTPPPNTWTATPCRWAASLWTPATSTGTTASSPCSPPPTSPTTGSPIPSSSARRPISPSAAPTSCGTSAPRPRP